MRGYFGAVLRRVLAVGIFKILRSYVWSVNGIFVAWGAYIIISFGKLRIFNSKRA